jgi:hypothetical protein
MLGGIMHALLQLFGKRQPQNPHFSHIISGLADGHKSPIATVLAQIPAIKNVRGLNRCKIGIANFIQLPSSAPQQ